VFVLDFSVVVVGFFCLFFVLFFTTKFRVIKRRSDKRAHFGVKLVLVATLFCCYIPCGRFFVFVEYELDQSRRWGVRCGCLGLHRELSLGIPI
jgi:uncharacterized YccA/Bax inhibitor family protein